MQSPKIIQFPFGSTQYLKEEHKKNMIFIHHTAGGASAINTAMGWNSNDDKIATSYIIGGSVKKSTTEKDGDIVECFDSKYWAYHLGLKKEVFTENKVPYQSLDKISIGIEICCWGQVTKQADGTFKNYVNGLVPKEEVTELVFALNPNIQGDTTIYYIQKKLPKSDCIITTIARGIAFGGELEYADEMTLGKSISNRQPIHQYIK
jgi:hypothetical protein